MKALNISRDSVLASDLSVADSLFARMKGLLGRPSLEKGEGLWIRPCKGIHTFGMRVPLDVVFLGSDMTVVAVKRRLAPNRLTAVYPRAASVLELPSGTLGTIERGDRVAIL